jgi:hypothetical protein
VQVWGGGVESLPPTSALTLLFGEISLFDEQGEIKLCDWLKREPQPGNLDLHGSCNLRQRCKSGRWPTTEK